MQVKEIMTKTVKYIDPNTALNDAAQIMLNKDIGALPVGENDRLVGMVTDRDITIRAVAKSNDPHATTVREIMTPKCIYCFEDDSIEEAAKNMGEHQIRRLPVLNKDKRLVGVVSLGDICCKGSKQAAVEALDAISKSAQ